MEILYCRNYPDGYNKISAIKPIGWNWTEIEREQEHFGILISTMTKEQMQEWSDTNKYCVNKNENGIEETPEEYLNKAEVQE